MLCLIFLPTASLFSNWVLETKYIKKPKEMITGDIYRYVIGVHEPLHFNGPVTRNKQFIVLCNLFTYLNDSWQYDHFNSKYIWSKKILILQLAQRQQGHECSGDC